MAERETIIQYKVRRESDRGVTMFHFDRVLPLVFVQFFGEVFHPVLAQRTVDVPLEPSAWLNS